MIGIPFIIRRQSDRGTEDTTVYLRTRRISETGRSMRQEIRRFHDATIAQSKAASRAAALVAVAMKGMDNGPLGDPAPFDLEALLEKQDKEMTEARNQADAAIDAATKIALMALEENYPPAVLTEFVDMLTDRELRAIVSTVEMGAMPADFFTLPGIHPLPSSTGRSGGSPGSDSSKQDSAEGTSRPE
jgi:hypothetical protein